MKSSTEKIASLVLAALLLTLVAAARDHNAFNGTWTLVPSKSDFAGQPVLQTGTVTIEDHEGNTDITRNFVYEGATRTSYYSDSVGSEHHATIHAGDLKSKTTWDRDTLKVTTTQSGVVTVETYVLGPDGTMTATVVRPDRPPFTLFFERK